MKTVIVGFVILFLAACAPADAPDVDDMAADMGGDADMGPIDCYTLDLDACQANSSSVGGPCEEFWVHSWNADQACNEPTDDRMICVPEDVVWDSVYASMVDSDGVCWGTSTALAESPPGWTYLSRGGGEDTPCSCVIGTEIIEGCTKPWGTCGSDPFGI